MIRKYLIFMLMCNVFVVFDAFSYLDDHKRNDGSIEWGPSGHCFIVYESGRQGWFCGTQTVTCSGHFIVAGKRHWRYRGENVEKNGNKYWCCAGDDDSEGNWVKANSWNQEDTERDGNYLVRKNICGEEISRVLSCANSDKVSRNGQCIDDCSGDQAFESKTSSTCVACPQTASQGVAIAEDGSRYCLKCNADTQIFKNKACKEKTSLTKLTFTNQADCFACENPSDMKKCLKKKADGAESGMVTDCTKYVGGTSAASIFLQKALNLNLKKVYLQATSNSMKLNNKTDAEKINKYNPFKQ